MAKSARAEKEERILDIWKKNGIFEKTLEKSKSGDEFVFYEGPPTANGRPGIHHLEARAFKDAIPRYKTMRGFHVRRKGGWDTHGLPVELQVEKQLGLKSKKEIETYGIEAFNEKCKASVWEYVHEWEDFTRRMGYWVDLADPYITYKPAYMESLWSIMKHVDSRGLLYKDYKVVPWCPRCGTALSSHELAQGYDTVKDLSVTVKFHLKEGQKFGNGYVTEKSAYILAWTTTPWTLPGNTGLAVGAKVRYSAVRVDGMPGLIIIANDRMSAAFEGHQVQVVHDDLTGNDLVGLEYEPLYPFLRDNASGAEKEKLANAFKVWAADFVTTADGTGVVHIAPMYGQDDFELGTKAGMPKYHLVNDDGTFKKEAGFLAGKFVKDEEGVAVEIIKDLAHRGLLFAKEKHEHTYPFCWRCKTPLIYFARDSWYIQMSKLRDTMVAENEGIHWEPGYIKEGRFGEWLREVKDWAISRERYWGTPLPIWTCESCGERKVVGSVAEASAKPKNSYYVMRHGEAENNVLGVLSGKPENQHHLTEKGRKQVEVTAASLKGVAFDRVFVSPFIRTQETLEVLRKAIHIPDDRIHIDPRIGELRSGSWDGRSVEEYVTQFTSIGRFDSHPDGVENYAEIKRRMGDFLYDVEANHAGETILVITHETPEFLLFAAAQGLDRKQAVALRGTGEFVHNAECRRLEFNVIPHNREYELDLHRPFIDDVRLTCRCGGEMRRAKEVMDVWFDSGAMPFAQDHYPFEHGAKTLGIFGGGQKLAYPADFISEAIDQTRGWFYTLHAIGALMGKGKAFKNVICLGHILDTQGKKMSKSLGNIVSPWDMMDAYGADALRLWMYSVNQPGESKNFDEKTVDEIVKKVFNLAANVVSFYKMYEDASVAASADSANVLDRWIIARMDELVATVTKGLDGYVFLEPTRAIREFIADLSQWYLRRSRDRFKEEGSDKRAALATARYVMTTLATVMAPFTPFFAEEIYSDMKGPLESVHLESWPKAGKADTKLIEDMEIVRASASRGLEARMSAKINVRQPLASLIIKNEKARNLPLGLVGLIRDEVNVKDVRFDATIEKDVELDTAITPALKEEGDLRELLRKIQDLRKEKGFTVNDLAVLIVSPAERALASKHAADITKATKLSAIEEGASFDLRRA